MTRIRIAGAVLALIVLAAVAAWRGLARDPMPAAFQGYVEGNLVTMASEEGGRIEALHVDSGDRVAEGQLLFQLDASLQEDQRREAEARLGQAEALAADTKAALQRPEQVAILRAQEQRASAQLDLSRNDFQRQQALFDRGITAKAQLDQARSAFDRDRAALEETKRQIQAAELAGRSGDIAATAAAARASAAALRQAENRLAKRRVVAPATGRVQDVFFRAGEVVGAGQPVLSLLPPGNLRIRFYVPEPMLSTVAIGQRVAFFCDRCQPGLSATVSYLSREAEFTPPVIFSDQERAKLVFRAEARPAAGIDLPIGLPVTLRPAAPDR